MADQVTVEQKRRANATLLDASEPGFRNAARRQSSRVIFAPGVRRVAPVLVLLGVAALARLAVLATPLRGLSGDEAAAGLMARNILHGHGYIFFAGQNYMGALDQYLQAGVLAVWPSSQFGLRVPDLLLSLVAAYLVHRLGRKILRSDVAALAAMALYASGSLFNLVYGTRASGAYNLALVVGLLALDVALTAQPRCRNLTAIGVLFGLGLWLSPVSCFLTIPAMSWRASTLRTNRRALVGLLAGTVAGIMPVLAWSLAHGRIGGFGSLSARTAPDSPRTRLHGLLSATLPEFLGLSWRNGKTLIPYAIVAVLLAALVLAWACALWRLRQDCMSLLTARGTEQPLTLLVIAAPLIVLLYIASSYTWWTGEPRYLYLAGPWIAWGVAALIHRSRRPMLLFCALLAANVVLLGLGLQAVEREGNGAWTGDVATASAWLGDHGVRAAYGDYRAAYTVTFLSEGRVTAVPYDGQSCRFPQLATQVAHAQPANAGITAWILSSAERGKLQPTLEQAGIRDSLALPTLSVYLVQAPASPAALGIGHPCI